MFLYVSDFLLFILVDVVYFVIIDRSEPDVNKFSSDQQINIFLLTVTNCVYKHH